MADSRLCPATVCGLFLSLIFATGAIAWADGLDYSGKYQGDPLCAEIHSADGGGYSGTLQMGASQFPLKAAAVDGQLRGTFTNQGTDFPFTATLDGDQLSLSSGGANYKLTRPTAGANPLGAAAVDDKHADSPAPQDAGTFDVNPGDKLVIDLGVGDVALKPWDQNTVQISAKKLLASQGNDADFYNKYQNQMNKTGTTITLHAFMPPDANGNVSMNTSGTPYRYEIMIPKTGLTVDLKTGMGNVDLDGASAATVASEMGNVTLHLPAGAGVTLNATGSTFKSDFPLAGQSADDSANGTINGGGPAIQVKATMGDVKVVKE
jgi:hypothetical protein